MKSLVHSPVGGALGVAGVFHHLHLFQKKIYDARRREGEKCVVGGFFLRRQFSRCGQAPSVTRLMWDFQAVDILFMRTVRGLGGGPMNTEFAEANYAKASAIVHWHVMLRDKGALLAMPGAHHKALLRQAHALHQGQLIDADDLSDLLEMADAALAYAIESLLDLDADGLGIPCTYW